jgi:thiosulfate reductase cytochrome b subunit
VTEDLPRRRMDGWKPLKVGHPDTAAAIAPQPEATPATEPAPAPVAETAPAAPRRRMGAPAADTAAAPAAGQPAAEPAVKTPEVKTPEPAQPAAKTPAAPAGVVEKPQKKEMSKTTKVVLTLLGVAVVAAGLVLVAQWLRTLDPVAEFLATYDGTPTHPDGVEAGIPAWVGWQHFFNFFIIVMVIRSGLLIRNQERPEAYWTPNDGGFFSPNTKNSPQKVSIQQWIHQSFNVLWVVNGLIFYVMVFVTGHWMRIVPTNWDIFPNIVSAGLQYLSLDWPAENSWVYYNALQIMTYFITVFIAAPIAVLTGLRLSTWWPQKAERLNKAFTLPVARKIHFFTMIYFILFIIVHLFLVFTTGVLHNMNIMFTARDASDWWGIAIFALSVAVTVGVAWLIKPIFISPIAEKTGTVSTR